MPHRGDVRRWECGVDLAPVAQRFPEGKLEGSWDQTALLDSSIASARDCLEKLTRAGELLAELVEKAGRLEPPYVQLYTKEPGGTAWTYSGIVSPLG